MENGFNGPKLSPSLRCSFLTRWTSLIGRIKIQKMKDFHSKAYLSSLGSQINVLFQLVKTDAWFHFSQFAKLAQTRSDENARHKALLFELHGFAPTFWKVAQHKEAQAFLISGELVDLRHYCPKVLMQWILQNTGTWNAPFVVATSAADLLARWQVAVNNVLSFTLS